MRNLLSKKFVIPGCILILATMGIYYFFFHDPVLAKVGDTKIRKSEALYRDKIIRMSFPEERRSMGLYQLMKSAINYEILKNNGIRFSEDTIEMEANRIDSNTRNPNQLQTIKDLFKNDPKAYLRVFVLPTLVDRTIYYDFFLNSEKIHEASVQVPLSFIAKAPDLSSLKDEAKNQNLKIQKIKISEKEGVIWEGLQEDAGYTKASMRKAHEDMAKALPGARASQAPTEEEEFKKWKELLTSLKEGQTAPMPVSFGESWLVLHYHKKLSPTSFEVMVVSFPKLEYGKWFEAEKAKLSIRVYDKSLPVPLR